MWEYTEPWYTYFQNIHSEFKPLYARRIVTKVYLWEHWGCQTDQNYIYLEYYQVRYNQKHLQHCLVLTNLKRNNNRTDCRLQIIVQWFNQNTSKLFHYLGGGDPPLHRIRHVKMVGPVKSLTNCQSNVNIIIYIHKVINLSLCITSASVFLLKLIIIVNHQCQNSNYKKRSH